MAFEKRTPSMGPAAESMGRDARARVPASLRSCRLFLGASCPPFLAPAMVRARRDCCGDRSAITDSGQTEGKRNGPSLYIHPGVARTASESFSAGEHRDERLGHRLDAKRMVDIARAERIAARSAEFSSPHTKTSAGQREPRCCDRGRRLNCPKSETRNFER